jgi:hypothetical protein
MKNTIFIGLTKKENSALYFVLKQKKQKLAHRVNLTSENAVTEMESVFISNRVKLKKLRTEMLTLNQIWKLPYQQVDLQMMFT